MVVGVVRAVGPPSTMRGSLSPSCSRTPRGVVHSGWPERFAEVAVMGRPRRLTTARGMAALEALDGWDGERAIKYPFDWSKSTRRVGGREEDGKGNGEGGLAGA